MLFVQRFGSLLQLNIHGHSAISDGVFTDDGQGGLVFRPLPPPSDEEVHWVCMAIAKAVLKLLSAWEACESDEEETQHLLSDASQSGPKPLFYAFNLEKKFFLEHWVPEESFNRAPFTRDSGL